MHIKSKKNDESSWWLLQTEKNGSLWKSLAWNVFGFYKFSRKHLKEALVLGECPSRAQNQFARNRKHCRSTAIISKVYFPHELLRWPRKRPLLFLSNIENSHCCFNPLQFMALYRRHHHHRRRRRAQWLRFWLDVLCLIFPLKATNEYHRKKPIIFQCTLVHCWPIETYTREKKICFIDLLKLDNAISVIGLLEKKSTVCAKAQNNFVKRKWMNIKSDYHYYYRYCCHSFFCFIIAIIIVMKAKQWNKQQQNHITYLLDQTVFEMCSFAVEIQTKYK